MAHAALAAYRQCEQRDPVGLEQWLQGGEATVVLKVNPRGKSELSPFHTVPQSHSRIPRKISAQAGRN